MNILPRYDSADSVLDWLGPETLILAREAADEGLHQFKIAREADPHKFSRFPEGRRKGMLNDLIGTELRRLVGIQAQFDSRLRCQINGNGVGTEMIVDPCVVIRPKVLGPKRAVSANYPTVRQSEIVRAYRITPSQYSLDFNGWIAPLAEIDRLWLTVACRLDELEEEFMSVLLGWELRSRYVWKEAVPIADKSVIARLSRPLADQIMESREQRSA
ncbi:MAG: hypothetical protein KDA16_12960 [Phycisphaerales bacterium]|nr:hypothetical protein [Phycisphaerales bacterium]